MLFFRQKKKSNESSIDEVERHKERRIVLLGTSSVGKTCLAYKYIHSRLVNDPYLSDRRYSNKNISAIKSNETPNKIENKTKSLDQIPLSSVLKFLKEYIQNNSESLIQFNKPQSNSSSENSPTIDNDKLLDTSHSTIDIEKSLQFSRISCIFQQIVHEVNEIQRYQFITQARNLGEVEIQNNLKNHENKLQKEIFLLNEQLKKKNEFNISLTNQLLDTENKLLNLQKKWMSERNEKVDLEMEKDKLNQDIKLMENNLKKVSNFLEIIKEDTESIFNNHIIDRTLSNGEYIINHIDAKKNISEYDLDLKPSQISLQDNISQNEDNQSNQGENLHEPIVLFEDSHSDDDSSVSSESVFSNSKSLQLFQKDSESNEHIFCPPSKQLMSCVRIFNKQSPKSAINSMIRCGFIPDDPKAIAIFLIKCGSLDPKKLGEYLGEEKNIEVLKHFAMYLMERLLIKFPFDIALKAFLQSIRLPKEGQQVSRITDAFSDAYMDISLRYKQHPEKYVANSVLTGDIKDRDNAFLLACSILMVNVELHSGRSNNTPMSRDQFVSLFNDEDVSHSYLKQVYNNIKEKEWKDETQTIDEQDDLYPPEVEQESHVLPTIRSSDNVYAHDDHQLRISHSMSSFIYTDNSSPKEKNSPISTSRTRTRSIHQRQKSKSFDIHTHSREDIPLYFSLREFSRRSIHTFQIRDTLSFEWAPNHYERTGNPLLLPETTEKHILSGDFFLCMYNTRNRSSFTAVEHILNHVSLLKGKEQPHSNVQDQVMIVAVDFSEDGKNEKVLRKNVVSTEEGHQLALRLGVPFVSVHLVKEQEVRNVFQIAVQYCIRPVSKHMHSLQKQMSMKPGKEMEKAQPTKKEDKDIIPFGVKKVSQQIGDHLAEVVFYVK